jgi:hypothetical protein
MEERNTDINTTIGFMLIGVILMFWIYTTPPPAQSESIDEDTNEQIEEELNSKSQGKNLLFLLKNAGFLMDFLSRRIKLKKSGKKSFVFVKECWISNGFLAKKN